MEILIFFVIIILIIFNKQFFKSLPDSIIKLDESNDENNSKDKLSLNPILILTIIGLITGYLFFGKVPITKEYIDIEILIRKNDFGYNNNVLGNLIIDNIREKILFTGITGLAIGLFVSYTNFKK